MAVDKGAWIKAWNLKSEPFKLNSKNTNIYLSLFSAKINNKNSQINKKTLVCVHFCTKATFPKTLAKCNCNGPSAFRCQRYR